MGISAGMDVDGHASIIPSILVSKTSTRECGFSMLSIDNELLASFATAPLSSPPGPAHTSESPRKKWSAGSSSVASSSQLASMVTNQSSRSAATSRITNAVALNSMQGSIN